MVFIRDVGKEALKNMTGVIETWCHVKFIWFFYKTGELRERLTPTKDPFKIWSPYDPQKDLCFARYLKILKHSFVDFYSLIFELPDVMYSK